MHLAEIAALRSVPAAGVLLALTRRCPLSCAHCSTESSDAAEQYPGVPFRRLVGSFASWQRPEVIVMSGGEALLRPRLVADLAATARAAGTRSYVLSGMFFARGERRIPPAILRAVGSVDHFAASLDAFHEREVSRREVFRALHLLSDRVPAMSLQLTGLGDDDPYIEDLVAEARREFADRLPILVTRLQPTGRARSLTVSRRSIGGPPPAGPCGFAAWPLVGYDGTVYACSRQSLVERVRPAHLVLGHAGEDSWERLRERTLRSPVLRAIRTIGPVATRERFSEPGCASGGVCDGCVGLAADETLPGRVGGYLASPRGAALELAVRSMTERRDPFRFSLNWASARYRDLVGLGWEGAA